MATQLVTMGVEEEFLLVDARTGALVPRSTPVLDQAGGGVDGQVHHELQLAQVETGTAVCRTLDEVRGELTRLRRRLAAAAERVGCRLAASGTHPFTHWAEASAVAPKPAYLALERDYQQLVREQLVCGCHVHVGIADEEEAIGVLNRVRPWLSPVLALAANSPFWCGVDTGYSSFRSEIWHRWPMAGTPHTFAGRGEYDDLVAALMATDSVDAPARIYWDVRPSARFPTLEFRVTDVCLTVDEAVMVAGLVRALAQACRPEPGDAAAAVRPELLRAASWRAARYGLDADLVDVVGRRAVPARELLDALLAFVRPALADNGDWEEVSALVAQTVSRGTGAARQRQALARTGDLRDVVELIVAETAPA